MTRTILRALSLAVLLTVVVACRAEIDSAQEPQCPPPTATATAPSTTPTTPTTPTIDPRCGAVEPEDEDEGASDPDEWTGTLHSDGNAGGCLATWDGKISLTVQPDGEVAGEASLTTTGQPGCTVLGGNAGTAYDEEFAVRGQLSGATFDLEFIEPTEACLALARGGVSIICWGVPGGSVAHDGDTVGDTFSTDLGQTTFETTLEFRCDTC